MEQLIPVADGEIWAEDTGGDGPAVVLAHPGDWADSSAWASVVGLLRGRHRVIGYDNRLATGKGWRTSGCVSG